MAKQATQQTKKTAPAVKAPAKAETKKTAPAKVQQAAPKQEQAAKAKGGKLYYFSGAFGTPSGKILRAYFVALMSAQIGEKLPANTPFKLWKGVNVSGHRNMGRLEYMGDGIWKLTKDGAQFFNNEEERPPVDIYKQMLAAVKGGTPPACYKRPMLAIDQ